VLDTAIDEKAERDKLKAKRNILFAQLEKNPQDIHLAIGIKEIDDQIAECNRKMEQKRKRRRE
jgi:hypothetical protein